MAKSSCSAVCGSLLFLLLLCSPAYGLVDMANCTFETSSCGWKANGSLLQDWKVSSGGVNWLSKDHTFEVSGKGRYASATGGGGYSGSLLESVVINPSDDICGIRFSYAVDYHGKLQVKVDPGGNWSTLGASYLTWTTKVIPMHVDRPSKVLFLMTFSNSAGGEAAVDDIQFLPCKLCTFERDLCSWTTEVQDASKQIPWTRQSGPTASSATGPSVDHTTLTSTGYYIYTEGTSNEGKEAKLVSQKLYYDDNVCSLKIAFHMYGKGFGSLAVHAIDDGNQIVTTKTIINDKNQGNSWKPYEITFARLLRKLNESTRLIVTGTLKKLSSDLGDTALDDVELLPCLDADICTFSTGTCSWNFAPRTTADSRLSWNLVQDPLNVIDNKLVANFSSISFPADQSTVLLESRLIFSENGVCSLRLTYEVESSLSSSELIVNILHPNGVIVDSFEVLARNSTGKPIKQEILFKALPVYVTITAEQDGFETGTIAIHDLQYLPCTYSSFEMDNLQWKNSGSFPVQWIKSQLCSSSQECPTDDHTYGKEQNGHFFLAKSNSVPKNTVAAGLSWGDVGGTEQCGVRLWYYMAYGTVVVSVKDRGSNSMNMADTWTTTTSWVFRELAFVQPTQMIGVEYTSLKDGGFSLALDDLQLTPCPQFTPCTFERSLCNWTVIADASKSVNATWIRWSGLAPGGDGKDVLATLDHTRNSSLGHFAYMAVKGVGDSDKMAVLSGVPLGRISRPCAVEFWYRILRNDSGEASAWLAVEQIFDGGSGKVVLWNATVPTSAEWKRAHVSLRATSRLTVRIDFRGFTTSPLTAINLDDITYTQCPTSTSFPTTRKTTKETTTQGFEATAKKPRLGEISSSPAESTPTPLISAGGSNGEAIGGAVGGSIALLLVLSVLLVLGYNRRHKKAEIKIAKETSSSSIANLYQNKSYNSHPPTPQILRRRNLH
eukprot:m.72380 g.72380  ORF g.72380 m.72380 type:complete len:946 (+) comp35798_c0_seq4:57-2894(+)